MRSGSGADAAAADLAAPWLAVVSVAAYRTGPVAAVGAAVCWSLPLVGLDAVACQLVRVAADLVAPWLAAVSAAVAVCQPEPVAVGAVVVSVVAAAGPWSAAQYVAAVGVSLAVAVECGVRALVVVPVSVA